MDISKMNEWEESQVSDFLKSERVSIVPLDGHAVLEKQAIFGHKKSELTSKNQNSPPQNMSKKDYLQKTLKAFSVQSDSELKSIWFNKRAMQDKIKNKPSKKMMLESFKEDLEEKLLMLNKMTKDLKEGFSVGSSNVDKLSSNCLVYAVGGEKNQRGILLQDTLKKFMQMKDIILLHKKNSAEVAKELNSKMMFNKMDERVKCCRLDNLDNHIIQLSQQHCNITIKGTILTVNLQTKMYKEHQKQQNLSIQVKILYIIKVQLFRIQIPHHKVRSHHFFKRQ